jgi:hypothetical protein
METVDDPFAAVMNVGSPAPLVDPDDRMAFEESWPVMEKATFCDAPKVPAKAEKVAVPPATTAEGVMEQLSVGT